jgi:hypothetical protein
MTRIIVDRGPIVPLVNVEVIDMSNRTWYYQRQWATNANGSSRHTPSSIEMNALCRELEEAIAYLSLRISDYILSPGLVTELQRSVSCLNAAREQVGVHTLDDQP